MLYGCYTVYQYIPLTVLDTIQIVLLHQLTQIKIFLKPEHFNNVYFYPCVNFNIVTIFGLDLTIYQYFSGPAYFWVLRFFMNVKRL